MTSKYILLEKRKRRNKCSSSAKIALTAQSGSKTLPGKPIIYNLIVLNTSFFISKLSIFVTLLCAEYTCQCAKWQFSYLDFMGSIDTNLDHHRKPTPSKNPWFLSTHGHGYGSAHRTRTIAPLWNLRRNQLRPSAWILYTRSWKKWLWLVGEAWVGLEKGCILAYGDGNPELAWKRVSHCHKISFCVVDAD